MEYTSPMSNSEIVLKLIFDVPDQSVFFDENITFSLTRDKIRINYMKDLAYQRCLELVFPKITIQPQK